MVRFQVLGPVEVHGGDRALEVRPPQQGLVMAVLAADAGRPVTVETLIDRVWDEAPGGARRTLHVLITRVRRMLEQFGGDGQPAVEVHSRSGGYLLDVDPQRVDVHRFRALVGAARTGTDHQRAGLLREAIALWQGEPLAGLSGHWAASTREAWREEYLDAVVAWAGTELRLRNAGTTLGLLSNLSSQHPLVESLTAALMRALCAVGRPAAALDRYARIRHRLAEELGTDPGPELQAVYQAILTGRLDEPGHLPLDDTGPPAEDPPPAEAQPPAEGGQPVGIPAQLPADIPGFAGRIRSLARLDSLLDADIPATAVLISAVSGTAGIGKTTLAVHWAHRVADRFPDGQLYVNLRGAHPGGQAMAPGEAIRGFLSALGVPPERVPPSLDAAAALYRTLLSGKRVLVVLDNARDAEQVRPLLPGTPTAMAVVTSRNQLTGLVAADGARPLTLAILSPAEARELLTRRLGADRVAAEPEAVEQIITACARLPLALAIVAARAQQTGFPLAVLAAELGRAEHRLDALTAGDESSEVRAVFSWSYAILSPPAARLFRLLGRHPGPDISAAAAASLAGVPPAGTRRLLAELAQANLIGEHVPGRYAYHDLLRAYASDLARDQDPEPVRRAAMGRLLDHYIHTAHAADRLLHPHREPIFPPLASPGPDTHPERPADHHAALAWLIAERPVLLAMLRRAADAGFDVPAFQLAWTLDTFLNRDGHWDDLRTAWQIALGSAERTGAPVQQAYALRLLGYAHIRLGRLDEAETELRRALDLLGDSGELVIRAQTLRTLAHLSGRRDAPRPALEYSRQALALFRAAQHRRGQAGALNAIGWYHALLGEFDQALHHCEQGLALHQEVSDRHGEAHNWDSLGYAHHHLGHLTRAADCFGHAVALYHDLGDRYNEADTLVHLGDTQQAAGEPAAARTAWVQALDILTDLGHPDAEAVLAKLRNLGQPAGTARFYPATTHATR